MISDRGGETEKYLERARFFLDVREDGEEYNQANIEVVEQVEAVGHAVRGCCMYAGMADMATLNGDTRYIQANRGPGEMTVWLPLLPEKARPLPAP